MKRYQKPTMVRYDRQAIIEMIGPVRTQYVPLPPPSAQCTTCNDVRVAPDAFLQGKVFDASSPLRVSVDTRGCTQFAHVEILIPNAAPAVSRRYARNAGSLSGSTWAVNVTGFQFQGPRGNHQVIVYLFDGNGNASAPCSATITVE